MSTFFEVEEETVLRITIFKACFHQICIVRMTHDPKEMLKYSVILTQSKPKSNAKSISWETKDRKIFVLRKSAIKSAKLMTILDLCPRKTRARKSILLLCKGGSRGRLQGVRISPRPPPHKMKLSSSYSLLKFVYLTGQWRHSLEVYPSWEKSWIRLCCDATIFKKLHFKMFSVDTKTK